MILTDQEIEKVCFAELDNTQLSFARAIKKVILEKIGKPVCYHYVEWARIGLVNLMVLPELCITTPQTAGG